jgi:hypothetical protein
MKHNTLLLLIKAFRMYCFFGLMLFSFVPSKLNARGLEWQDMIGGVGECLTVQPIIQIKKKINLLGCHESSQFASVSAVIRLI